MAPPTPQQVEVATQALRIEAGVWETESGEMGKVSEKANGLRLNRIEAGLFQVIFNTYGQVIDQVVARSNEGVTQMADVARTLRTVADTYDQEDAAGVHRMTNIY